MKPTELRIEITQQFLRGFFSRIEVNKESGCWEWTGFVSSSGYGGFKVSGQSQWAHRVAYSAFVESLPLGKGRGAYCVDHLCRNRKCCNPAHLQKVVWRENILRGNGPSARQSRQTHCMNGHLLSGGNVYRKPSAPNTRNCLICMREYSRAYRRAHRQVNAK